MIIDCVQDVPTSGMFMSTRSLWAEMAIDSTGQAIITLNQLKIGHELCNFLIFDPNGGLTSIVKQVISQSSVTLHW